VRAREAELAVTRARMQEAAAAAAEARTALEDLTIRAPVDGTVTGRFVDVGEVVNAGTPLLELTDLGRLYLKGYLPETEIGRVRRGMPARIHVDAYPGEPFAATVTYVAARAEFTPKEVQTVDERVKLVYEVRLHADENPGGRLNPGQPADAMIRWRDGAAWLPPRN
jgi:HlyD family secretion protein